MPGHVDDAVGEKDLATITANFKKKTQLDAANHPKISFKATKCEGSGSKWNVTGNLTMRGATKPITIPMTITEDGANLRGRGGAGAVAARSP